MKALFVATSAAIALAASPVDSSAQQTTEPNADTIVDRSNMRPDEAGIWAEMDRAEARVRTSGRLVSDTTLNQYLRDVACRVAAEVCPQLRFYVMDIPISNALMAPNGYSEVWTGILLRIENEAQLAFVLGHEVTHYTEDHSINRWRAMRTRMNIALVASAGVAVAGIDAAMDYPQAAQDILEATGHVIDAIHLATIASIFGFSRENEEEADALGFDLAAGAGYDPSAAAAMWSNSLAEQQASDSRDVRRQEARASLFSTHPLTTQRVQSLRDRVQGRQGGETHRDRYRAAIRPFLDSWLRAELRRRDFGQTLHLLDRLGAHGDDLGVIEFYRGEVHRLRRGDGDRARAKAHYANAIGHGDAPAAAWRELGDLELRDGANQAAADHFRTYLERAPDAEDRALVEARLAQLTQGGAQ